VIDGQEYALKKVKMNVLKEKEKENSLNEVRLLASIEDDYIVAYKVVVNDQLQFPKGGFHRLGLPMHRHGVAFEGRRAEADQQRLEEVRAPLYRGRHMESNGAYA
jgi:hypothetical protein